MSRKNESTKLYCFDIFRWDAASGAPPYFQSYKLAAGAENSVLEALLRLQDEQDPTLAFRYSCRGAVCGSSSMSINGRLNLACRVLLKNLPAERAVLEPLPHFPVIKDLVVDLASFWAKYEKIQPWLHSEIEQAGESEMSELDRERIDQYVNCILCALCVGACPVSGFDENFTGPAALAKFYRFLADSREARPPDTLEAENGPSGAWGCHTVTRCIEVCPKNVRPTDGISGVRRRLVVHRLKSAFGRK